jgi:hypothetical protein
MDKCPKRKSRREKFAKNTRPMLLGCYAKNAKIITIFLSPTHFRSSLGVFFCFQYSSEWKQKWKPLETKKTPINLNAKVANFLVKNCAIGIGTFLRKNISRGHVTRKANYLSA